MASDAGFSLTGDTELIQKIQNLSDVSNRETSAALRKVATNIQKLAQKYAPVDRGNLEDAIKVVGADRAGKGGAFSTYYVGVDEDMPIPERPGHLVGQYATEMHEGDYDLGPGSLAKEAKLGVAVGPKYLERALDDLSEPSRKYLQDVLDDVLKRYG